MKTATLYVSLLFCIDCGQVTATDVNGLVTRGPAVQDAGDVEAGSTDAEPDRDKTAPADTRAGDGATSVDAASTSDVFRSMCGDHLADLRVTECRPGCGTCVEKNGIPVDACWADGFQCVHSCDECR